MLKKSSYETCSAAEKDTSGILHKTTPAERRQMLPWCWFSSSSPAHNSAHLQWPQLFLWWYMWRHKIPTATTVINANFLVKNKTAREKSSSCCLEWLQTQPKLWLNFLHPVTVLQVNLLSSTGIFLFRRKAKFSHTVSFKTQMAKQYWEYHQLWALLLNYQTTKRLALYL